MTDRAPLLAVLIDGDNVAVRYADAIFDEVAKLGEASIRRIYGDFTNPHLKGWSETAASIGALPYHNPANTAGKNATDIGLVIDAMDLLHADRVDGFVLVSSDSDFTRLASRIREQGKPVYGIGEQKAPASLVNACNRFIHVENILVSASEPAGRLDLNHAYQRIMNAFRDVEMEDGWANLGPLGSQLYKRYPDFDPRAYGVAKLSDLISRIDRVELERRGKTIFLRPKTRDGDGK